MAQNSLLADVPFAFEVGDRSYPAGTYLIVRQDNPNLIQVRSTDLTQKPSIALTLAPSPNPKGTVSLSFERVGDCQFLTAASYPGFRLDVPEPRRAKTMRSNGPAIRAGRRGEIITIAATLK
jgi:hypothetical protein